MTRAARVAIAMHRRRDPGWMRLRGDSCPRQGPTVIYHDSFLESAIPGVIIHDPLIPPLGAFDAHALTLRAVYSGAAARWSYASRVQS